MGAKKRFLSRTARYSGLLNVLEFADCDITSAEQVSAVLIGANSWMAFNVSQTAIPSLSETAVSAGLRRAIFTIELPEARINETVIPEFTLAKDIFQAAGASFTGIRHGRIMDGGEDNPYEIVNASIPCLESTVERGVLARVAAELLCIDQAFNSECGLSSSSAFAAAYLNILRSSGLTRQQEVTKMFTGGLQRVAKLTVDEYEAEQKRAEDAKVRIEERKAEAALEALKEKEQESLAIAQAQLLQSPEAAAEEEFLLLDEVSVEDKVQKRTQDILRNVWREFETRLYSKSTSREEFFDANRDKARALAEKEFDEERVKRRQQLEEKRSRQELLDRLVDVNRKQYSKLLALERKELQSQKEISEVWVKYIYMLLETTVEDCKTKGMLFYNMDEFAQTMQLRAQANELRAKCNLPPYDVVYDPLDAAVIVARLADTFPGLADSEDNYALLESKHGNSLKNIPALRGAKQIISAAIETLQRALPAAPPTISEMRQTDSKSKQELVSQMRIQATRNRGKPKSAEESPVGRM